MAGSVLFCHGMPGSAADARLLAAGNPEWRVVPLALLDHAPGDVVKALPGGHGPAHVVGFSIGAMAAMRLAAQVPERVERLTLVSAAAPLSLGDFLPHMAGKPVFEMAMRRPRALAAMTWGQGALGRVAPGAMIKALFAQAGEMERTLLADPEFRAVLTAGFSESFGAKRAAYLDYLRAYVSDWAGLLAQVRCPVDLWHGSKDTWSPLAMATALQAQFEGASLTMVDGAEHYSTLARVRL
ncbi:alpha/beta fold hydrolase [Tropicibacter naphthalenivorans]|uniref:Acetoin dehydrogenase E2 subunit dihydrolipoyllysine-residue acetyltransferase n=1 Tax=Tropicibacter naphthalenivorans TaxID=441103 RepID=A0A0P1GFV0_9RHOB|nr:alpha/beta hydrolase [Tropicibacter naphthalenivorans]CUH80413.1 acetoin dehydrogenase E2 subunit dihydrolipoyllysine-residue acetyltransferase [Tropicibacter naphthalenivorans]SMC86211.1 Pimeloyl-ACP methyl ester carboxylesterase [Tropicibacter naphthalenivorans]